MDINDGNQSAYAASTLRQNLTTSAVRIELLVEECREFWDALERRSARPQARRRASVVPLGCGLFWPGAFPPEVVEGQAAPVVIGYFGLDLAFEKKIHQSLAILHLAPENHHGFEAGFR